MNDHLTQGNAMAAAEYKSGYIAIIGSPNAGKSTLMNRILGEKISITSRKPQTTRNRILGIAHRPGVQMIFIDTPGVHTSGTVFNTKLTERAFSSISDADIILMLADASKPDRESEKMSAEKLKDQSKPVILALNKTDLLKRRKIEMVQAEWQDAYPFRRVLPISAKHGAGVEALVQEMELLLPFGPQYFPDNIFTDMPERFIAGEIIREKVFRFTGEEIPYATAVTVESFQEDDRESIVKIHASVHVERDSQKGIVIGKSAQMLKKIGTAARLDIEKLLGTKVFLRLHVRVRKNWSKDPRALADFGYA